MSIYVGTNFTQMYYPVIRQYRFLETLEALRGVEKFALVTDFRPEFMAWLQATFKTIRFIPFSMSKVSIPDQVTQVSSLQYGDFIDHVPGLADNDYVIFIDSDITIQRQFTEEELRTLEEQALTYLSLNARGNHSLTEELSVISQNPDLATIKIEFGDIDRMACFNTGVIGNQVTEWKRARDIYVESYPRWSKLIRHKAAVQWFESWLYQNRNFKMFDPRSEFVKNIHAHCHEGSAIQFFGLKRDQEGMIVRGDVPVLFAHAHYHEAWQHML